MHYAVDQYYAQLIKYLWWRSQDIVQMFYQAFNHDHRFLFHFIIIVTISLNRELIKISKVFFLARIQFELEILWLTCGIQAQARLIALVCVLVMCLYYWSLGAADTQFTGKQAFYEKIGEIMLIVCCA